MVGVRLMANWLKKYWLEIIIFVVVAIVLVKNMAVDKTWINTNSDGIHLTFAAKYLYAAHKTSAPLYLLLGHLFLYIPFGTEFWRMALISVLGTFIGSVFVYLIIREHLKEQKWARLYALIGVVIFAGSALIMSQSIIVKYYSLTAMFGLIAYYLLLRKRYPWCVVALGAGIATHGIILFTALPLFVFNKELRKWKSLWILAGFSLFYLYAPLVGRFNPPPYNMWGNLTVGSQIADVYLTMMMLSGNLAIYDIPKRIFDIIGILGVSLGLALIVIITYFIKSKQLWKNQLFWLFSLPIIFYLGNLSPQTYVYNFPAIAYGAIIVGIQLPKMKRYWLVATAIIALGLFGYNSWFFDIGKQLDPNLSATEFYTKELPKIPDGQIFMPQYGWEWTATIVYDIEEHRNIVPVCIDTLLSPIYQQTLTQEGVKYDDTGIGNKLDLLQNQNILATSIIKLNDNVWTTVPTDPQTYGAKVVPTNHDASLVIKIADEPPGMVHWKPSSPYGILTGSIEVNEWKYITMSNKNAMWLFVLAMGGFMFVWFGYRLIGSMTKKKKEARI